jgi:hypothetical protein
VDPDILTLAGTSLLNEELICERLLLMRWSFVAHKVFVSYHHDNDQAYADEFRDFYGYVDTLIDKSLPQRIDSNNDNDILGQIRTQYLGDSTVTVVLIGQYTWARKWIDWEIYSSLRPYGDRTVNGLLGIVLPGAKRLPDRFADNFQMANLFGKQVQVGYAKAVMWEDVAPPPGWRIFGNTEMTKARRSYLTSWINAAYDNRSRTESIQNTRPRMDTDIVLHPWWW